MGCMQQLQRCYLYSCRGSVKLRCHQLQVDEEGTEAAAVTLVEIGSFSIPQQPP